MATDKRILVIGAGASGLTAIKSCKEESLDVICYEKTKSFGGRWRYTENSVPGAASVMKSTICTSSKEMASFSDFPPPKNFPNYLHHTKMLSYLTMYAQKFDLTRHIKYQREVIRIIPSADFENKGKWLVTTLNDFNKSEVTEEFDGVMVCTGRLSQPRIPEFRNKAEFIGCMLHTQALTNVSAFEDLNILVIGSGNSAVEAAVEISSFAKQVYLSTRSGFWLFPKVGPRGLPYDMSLIRRDVHFLQNMCSQAVNHYVEKYLETKINHAMSNIKPPHRALERHPTINDDLPDKILTGRVIIKGKISRFEKHGVYFEYEDDFVEVDAVIFGTGYKVGFPFLDQDVYRDSNGQLNLYKKVFPKSLKHPTLAFIGFVESSGPHIPISESQTRWAARVFSQKAQLPSSDVIDAYVTSRCLKTKENINELMEDYITYMDDLAEEYGVKPNMSSLLFKDASLFWTCFTGPFLPYQYRLVGPHSWKDARKIILDYSQRVDEPFKTRFSRSDRLDVKLSKENQN